MRKLLIALLVLGIVQGCSKKSDSTANTIPVDGSGLPLSDTSTIGDTTVFFDIVLDGKRQLQISQQNKFYAYWTGTIPYGAERYGLFEQGILNDIGKGLVLYRGNIYLEPGDTSLLQKNQRMYAGFVPNQYPFTKDTHTSSGVILHWTDAAGKTWGTELGTGDQTGGYFHIVNRINLDTNYGSTGITHAVYLRCIFKCTLYDGNGNSLQIKNGTLGISLWL